MMFAMYCMSAKFSFAGEDSAKKYSNSLGIYKNQAITSINVFDTVVFDLTQAIITPTTIEFPVSILSDDTVNALDFSMKFNSNVITYDTIINHTNYVQGFFYFNTNDSTLRFTSYSLQRYTNDTILVSVRFILLSGGMTASDLNTMLAYLNGDPCSIKIVASSVGLANNSLSNLYSFYPNPSNNILNLKASKQLYWSLSNVNGQIVKGESYLEAGASENINVADVANGLYFLKVRDNENSQIAKVLINH